MIIFGSVPLSISIFTFVSMLLHVSLCFMFTLYVCVDVYCICKNACISLHISVLPTSRFMLVSMFAFKGASLCTSAFIIVFIYVCV